MHEAFPSRLAVSKFYIYTTVYLTWEKSTRAPSLVPYKGVLFSGISSPVWSLFLHKASAKHFFLNQFTLLGGHSDWEKRWNRMKHCKRTSNKNKNLLTNVQVLSFKQFLPNWKEKYKTLRFEVLHVHTIVLTI